MTDELAPDTSATERRAVGLLQGLAWGDALGARYEPFGLVPGNALVRRRPRIGRGIAFWTAPGAWTDDTDQALGLVRALLGTLVPDRGSGVTSRPVAAPTTGLPGPADWHPASERTASGVSIRAETIIGVEARDAFLLRTVQEWLEWYRRTSIWNMGANTHRILRDFSDLQRQSRLTLSAVRSTSDAQLRHTNRGGGNGAVMRTAPLALIRGLGDQEAFTLAGEVAALTHPLPEAREAAGVWTLLCRQAVVRGRVSWRDAVPFTRDPQVWLRRLLTAGPPGRNGPDGFAPTTVMDAVWCVRQVLDPTAPTAPTAPVDPACPAGWLLAGTRLAVRRSRDSDTVAAVVGSLLGALAGGDDHEPPEGWERVHGGEWTGVRWDLDTLGTLAGLLWRRPLVP